MSRLPLALAAVLVLTAFAGCLTENATVPNTNEGPAPLVFDEDWAAKAVPFGDKHDHSDVSHHVGLSTPNFELLGWDPLIDDYHGRTAGGYFCGGATTTAEGRRIGVVHSFISDTAFVVMDLTDPAAPMKIGEFILENAHVYDSTVTPDGKHVILGTSPNDRGPDPKPGGEATDGLRPLAREGSYTFQVKFKNACTGEITNVGPEQSAPLASGIVMVGIQDPTKPTLEDYRTLPLLGAHSISSAEVDGKTYVVGSVTNLVHPASYYGFFEVGNTPAGYKLVPLSVYQAPPPASTKAPITNGHVDATIAKHPVTNRTYAYLANWDAGVVIVDITNPRVPTYVGSWTDFPGGLGYLAPGSKGDTGQIHGVLPVGTLWDGKHYTLVGQEVLGHPTGRPTGAIHILDDTDPKNPVLVGSWTLPVDVTWGGTLMFSTHYMQLVNRTMFVTLYHGGVWAVDLSTEEKLANPPSVGVFIPAKASPKAAPPPSRFPWSPLVLDMQAFPNGDLAIFDGPSGVYMVRFDASQPAPERVWEGANE